jgi:hypothetical protein
LAISLAHHEFTPLRAPRVAVRDFGYLRWCIEHAAHLYTGHPINWCL